MPNILPIYYPPTAFYFSLKIIGSDSPADYRFQEISGISVEMDTEPLSEGGENRFQHKLPVKTKYTPLVLKRGAVLKDSFLSTWCNNTLRFGIDVPIQTHDLLVHLLDEKQDPMVSWSFKNAWPISWEASALNAQESSILFETIKMQYTHFEIIS